MGSGVALSTPRDHLNNIEMAIKVCGQLAASARASFGAAANASPLGSLLIAMGRKTLPLLEEQEEIQERIHNGIHDEPSAIADDQKFDHLGDAMKSVLKLSTMTPKPPGDGHAKKVHEAKIREAAMSMPHSSVHIARQEGITDMHFEFVYKRHYRSIKLDSRQRRPTELHRRSNRNTPQ